MITKTMKSSGLGNYLHLHAMVADLKLSPFSDDVQVLVESGDTITEIAGAFPNDYVRLNDIDTNGYSLTIKPSGSISATIIMQTATQNPGFVLNPASNEFDCRNITIDRLIFKFDQTAQGDTTIFATSMGDTNTIKNVRIQNCVFLVKSPNGQSGLYDSTDGFDSPSSYFVNNTIIVKVAAVGGQTNQFLLGALNHIGENNVIVIIGTGTHKVGDGAAGWDYLAFYKSAGTWAGTDGWTPSYPPPHRFEGNPNFVDLNADIFAGNYDLTASSTTLIGNAHSTYMPVYDILNRTRATNDIGAYGYVVTSAPKIFLTQRTNKHVIKRLDSSYVYDAHFGTYGTKQTDTTGFWFPEMATTDGTNIFVCDRANSRIVKLNTTPAYVSQVSVATEIGSPYAITFDGTNLYVIGIKNNASLSIAKLTTSLVVSKYTNNLTLPSGAYLTNPTGICKDFTTGYFLIAMEKFLKIHEAAGSFDTLTLRTIQYESDAKMYGCAMHSNGFLYLNAKKEGKYYILKVNSSYKNVGASSYISKGSSMIFQSNLSNDLLINDFTNKKVYRYDSDLNQVETIFSNTGSAVQTSCTEISSILEMLG